MASLCLWPLSVYGPSLSMASLCLWPLSAYGLSLSMASLCLFTVIGALHWSKTIYEPMSALTPAHLNNRMSQEQ